MHQTIFPQEDCVFPAITPIHQLKTAIRPFTRLDIGCPAYTCIEQTTMTMEDLIIGLILILCMEITKRCDFKFKPRTKRLPPMPISHKVFDLS